jgi:hypothetical protein
MSSQFAGVLQCAALRLLRLNRCGVVNRMSALLFVLVSSADICQKQSLWH